MVRLLAMLVLAAPFQWVASDGPPVMSPGSSMDLQVYDGGVRADVQFGFACDGQLKERVERRGQAVEISVSDVSTAKIRPSCVQLHSRRYQLDTGPGRWTVKFSQRPEGYQASNTVTVP